AGGAVVSRAIQSAAPVRGTLWLVPGLRPGSWRAAVERLIHRLRPQVTVWFQQPGLEQRLPGAHVVDLPAGVLGLRSAGPYVAALHRLAEEAAPVRLAAATAALAAGARGRTGTTLARPRFPPPPPRA